MILSTAYFNNSQLHDMGAKFVDEHNVAYVAPPQWVNLNTGAVALAPEPVSLRKAAALQQAKQEAVERRAAQKSGRAPKAENNPKISMMPHRLASQRSRAPIRFMPPTPRPLFNAGSRKTRNLAPFNQPMPKMGVAAQVAEAVIKVAMGYATHGLIGAIVAAGEGPVVNTAGKLANHATPKTITISKQKLDTALPEEMDAADRPAPKVKQAFKLAA